MTQQTHFGDELLGIRKNNVMNFHECPNFVNAWPLIVLGFLLYFIGIANEEISHDTLGKIFVLGVIVQMVIQGLRLNLYVVAFIALVVLLGLLQVPLVSDVLRHLWAFDFNVSLHAPLVVSLVLGFIYLVMVIAVRFFARWRISTNEIEKRRFGRKDESMLRAGKVVIAEYPNLFVTLISLGGGDIVVRDSKNQAELQRIENVPLLWFRISWISERLQATYVSPALQSALIEEEEHG